MWLLFAFSGPVLWAASTHIDKYLVDRYFRDDDTAVLMVFTALIGVIMLPPIWYFEPSALHVPAPAIGIMIASGIAYMAAMLFYLRAIQAEEASVVAPLFQASTLFTFLFGWLILGETLTGMQIAGAVLVVAGAVLVSFDVGRRHRFKRRLVVLMVACTAVLALSSIAFKYFAVRDEFWVTTSWTYVGEALFGLGIVAVPRYRRQLAGLLRSSPGPVLSINAANELINLGGGLGVRYAFMLAPVALVTAISSTTTLFVFAFGTLLSVTFPRVSREGLTWPNLARKGAASLLIAAGVALMSIRPG